MDAIRARADREVVAGFVEAAEKLTETFRELLRSYERPMLKAGSRERGEAVLVEKVGVEFLEPLFGRERQLEETERFMTTCRQWNMRFDENCKVILRESSA